MIRYTNDDNLTGYHSNRAMHLLLVCILLFGVFHVSYQHNVLAGNAASHEQSCEYCSSTGSSNALLSTELTLDPYTSASISPLFYAFFHQISNFYSRQNPRAPPAFI